MRLIDADALMQIVRAHDYPLRGIPGSVGYGMFTDGFQQAVDAVQTVDAVPVVRCKDCVYARRWYSDRCLCDLWAKDGIDVFDDGFCNYGERKEDGNATD